MIHGVKRQLLFNASTPLFSRVFHCQFHRFYSSETTLNQTCVEKEHNKDISCQLLFGRYQPCKLNHVQSINDLRLKAAKWLSVSDPNRIRLVKLPTNEKEKELQLSGQLKPNDSDVISEQDSNIEQLKDLNIQVLLEIPVKIRYTTYSDPVIKVYIHGMYGTQDFARALHHYGSWKYKYLIVKYAYQEGFGPEYVGPEDESVYDRVFISRDQDPKFIQQLNMPAKMLGVAAEGKVFELIVTPSFTRRLITTSILFVILGLDTILYCAYLP